MKKHRHVHCRYHVPELLVKRYKNTKYDYLRFHLNDMKCLQSTPVKLNYLTSCKDEVHATIHTEEPISQERWKVKYSH